MIRTVFLKSAHGGKSRMGFSERGSALAASPPDVRRGYAPPVLFRIERGYAPGTGSAANGFRAEPEPGA